jgi:hypothetical protein
VLSSGRHALAWHRWMDRVWSQNREKTCTQSSVRWKENDQDACWLARTVASDYWDENGLHVPPNNTPPTGPVLCNSRSASTTSIDYQYLVGYLGQTSTVEVDGQLPAGGRESGCL